MDSPRRRAAPLPLPSVSFADAFWSPRIAMARAQTLPFEYDQLAQTGRIDALRLTWRPGHEPRPHIFWESDVAKWIEAASYSLATSPDPALDALVDETIALLAHAQQPDGYLNVYFTVVEPGKRWSDLRDAHELYCAGHLIEAGVAHHQATAKTTLLDIVRRYADYIATVFGPEPGQRRGYPGHEEIELALVKLYRLTGERRYLELSRFFVDERGRRPFYFEQEAAERGTPGFFGDHFAERERQPEKFRQYNQSHAPVREQGVPVGHAVRAMYLYCAMADLAGELGDAPLLAACERLWDHLTERRMYITGGVGSAAANEGFTADYDLPNDTAYAETCAAVGLVFWARRMAEVTGDARYVDILERALYNGVLSGISLDGRSFFYDNPLASTGSAHRREWFGCACCPPNIARLLTSLGDYVYAQGEHEAIVNLYVGGSARFELAGQSVTLRQQTGYPWDGAVRLELEMAAPATFTLSLRLPGWCRAPSLRLNGAPVDLAPISDRGYARISRAWRPGDVLELELPMPVERAYAHPAVSANIGRVALTRGPIVYCIEQADHDQPLEGLALPKDGPLRAEHAPDLLGGVTVIRSTDSAGRPLTAVPYYAWDNRAPGPMDVWIREEG